MLPSLSRLIRLGFLLISFLLIACTWQNEVNLVKINFDISLISPEGLTGKSDGLRSVNYEFCLPANDKYLAEIKQIDPTIQYYSHSRGRIGCNRNQYLCIGNTHNPHWQDILKSLANLPYIERIDESFAE